MMRENNGRPLNKVVMTSEDCQVYSGKELDLIEEYGML